MGRRVGLRPRAQHGCLRLPSGGGCRGPSGRSPLRAGCSSIRERFRNTPSELTTPLPGRLAARPDSGKNPTLAVERKILRRSYHTLRELGDAALAMPVPAAKEVAA